MLLRDTFRYLIYNELHKFFRPCNAKLVESDRMNVTIQQIEDNLMELRRAIQGVPPHFCVNIDEMGHTEFGDAVQKIVIVPSNYDKNEASYPIEQAGKRASCIACISPIGLFCHPQFTIEERSTIDINLFNYISKDTVQIVGTDSGFVNTRSFLLWLNEVFIPELHIQRENHKYFGKMVIITDGLPAHKLAFNQIDLDKENIIVHYLEAHSSDQLQPLETIFRGTKWFLSNFETIFCLSPAANQKLKIYQALHQMCSQTNGRAEFKSAGMAVQIQFKNGQITEQMEFEVV